MDSRLLFAVVLLCGVCACAAFPFPFPLPATGFAPVNLPINATNGTCTATYSCAGEGDDCLGDQYSGCANNNNGSCCAGGLYCVSGTCAVDNNGATCTTQGLNTTQCYSALNAPIECVGSPLTCQYVYGPGDNCAGSANCMYGLSCNSDGVCQGIAVGQSCNYTEQCTYGSTCQLGTKNGTNTTSLVCVASLGSGDKCPGSNPVAQCITGTVCFNGNCVALYSLDSGATCTTDLCGEGLLCAVNNKTCVAVTDDLTSCTTTSDCPNNNTCWCSSYSGNSFCTPVNYNPCAGEGADLIQCQLTNNCTDYYESSDSCVYNNCYSDLKKASSCGCDGSDTVLGGCSYSQFCGGFPVWAIIVIIIVAIVLVLAIVLLVFFMMRRRRVYDSI